VGRSHKLLAGFDMEPVNKKRKRQKACGVQKKREISQGSKKPAQSKSIDSLFLTPSSGYLCHLTFDNPH
jgi:hypothetical protein